jgi:D-glycero-D-manno-heptose 1,7-bisphosphate phosphatase
MLDRDGTIIVEKPFLADPAGVELIPGAAAAIRRLNDAGWVVSIVTNQSGIGIGRYSFSQMHATNARVVELLAREGARLDTVEFCPHHPQAGHPLLRRVCGCRKPAIGMAVSAARRTGAWLTGCAVVGDRTVDIEMALRLGGAGIMVLTGYGERHRLLAERRRLTPSAIVPALPDAVDWLLTR